MSKKSRAKAKDKRRKEKLKKKAAKRALYESYTLQGINKKSFRQKKNAKKKSVQISGVDHPLGKCGNLGCKKCHGINFKPFLDTMGFPRKMPQWMFKKWHAEGMKKFMTSHMSHARVASLMK